MIKGNGFTLVELLVAMVVGAMLLVSLSWAVATLARQLPTRAPEARDTDLAAVAPMLGAMIEQAQPLRPGAAFRGDEKSLDLVVPAPMAAGLAGPLDLKLRVESRTGGEALIASVEPVDATAPFPAAARAPHVLVHGYEEIRFGYIPAAQAEASSLPRLVTISFAGDRGATQRISAAPRLDSDGRCRFDPISMTCR